MTWVHTDPPKDADKWLECNGQAVDQAKYPALYALMKTVPNLNEQFLRGGADTKVGNTATDTIKKHTVSSMTTSITVPQLVGRAVKIVIIILNFQ